MTDKSIKKPQEAGSEENVDQAGAKTASSAGSAARTPREPDGGDLDSVRIPLANRLRGY